MAEKKIDAIKMVRQIRDKHHEQFGDKPIKERLAYYRQKAQDFEERSGITTAPMRTRH